MSMNKYVWIFLLSAGLLMVVVAPLIFITGLKYLSIIEFLRLSIASGISAHFFMKHQGRLPSKREINIFSISALLCYLLVIVLPTFLTFLYHIGSEEIKKLYESAFLQPNKEFFAILIFAIILYLLITFSTIRFSFSSYCKAQNKELELKNNTQNNLPKKATFQFFIKSGFIGLLICISSILAVMHFAPSPCGMTCQGGLVIIAFIGAAIVVVSLIFMLIHFLKKKLS